MTLDQNCRPYNLRSKKFLYRRGRVKIHLKKIHVHCKFEWLQKCIIYNNKDNGGENMTVTTRTVKEDEAAALGYDAVAVILNPLTKAIICILT